MPVNPDASVRISAFNWVPPFAQGQVRDLRPRWARMPSGPKSTTKASSPKRKPIVAASPFARSPEYMVRNDIMIDAGESGSVGSCSGERVAHRPICCNMTSAS